MSGWWFARAVSIYGWFHTVPVVDGLHRLGEALRAARYRMGASQMHVEELSGVDQTVISRLELAKTPGLAVGRFVLVATALGRNFPLGWCPHDHDCAWQEPGSRRSAARQQAELLYPGSPAWEALRASTQARHASEETGDEFDRPDHPDVERPDVRGMRLPP